MDNNEESKRSTRPRSPSTPLSPIHEAGSSPRELDGGRGFGPVSDEENQMEGEESFDDYNLEGLNDYEYFSSRQFLEGEGSNSYRESDDEDEDDELDLEDIDPDELSYEELIELGEIIGEESRGLPREQVDKCLRSCSFKRNEWVIEIDRCVICQVEYGEGEEIVAVNPCEHPYHVDCITQWLQLKKICPICSSEVSPTKDCV